MKKVRYIAGLAGIIPVAAGLMTPSAAHAAAGETAARSASTTGKTVNLTHLARPEITAGSRFASIDANSVYLNKRSGGKALMYFGDVVKVSCYYKGTGTSATGLPDPYWDHVIYESSLNHVHGPYHDIGHVADSYVNLGGVEPPQTSIPPCG